MINKKAISPLIATILLVAVALSLAGILYSWSSQNFRDTTTNVSDTSAEWIDCSNVNITLDSGCRYDSETGFSNLFLVDRSTVKIDQNIIVTVIDGNENIVSMEINPLDEEGVSRFSGGIMNLSSILNENNDFIGLETPLYRVQTHVNNCPDKTAYISKCD